MQKAPVTADAFRSITLYIKYLPAIREGVPLLVPIIRQLPLGSNKLRDELLIQWR